MNINKLMVRGAGWSTITQFILSGATAIQIVILARLLLPRDFGLFGIALISIGFYESMSQLGFRSAIIHREGDIKEHLHTFWVTNIVRSILIAGLITVFAKSIASYLNEPEAALIITYSSLIVVFRSLLNPATIIIEKELNYRLELAYKSSGAIISLAAGIYSAYVLRNAWSLLIGFMAGTILEVFTSYVVYPYLPKFKFSRARFRELFTYGKWITISKTLAYVNNRGFIISLGKILDISALGSFQIADKLRNFYLNLITKVINKVLFPGFSMIKSDLVHFKEVYLKSQKLINIILFPTTALLLILTDRSVLVILGERWHFIVPTTRVLLIIGFLQTIGGFGNIVKAIGRTRFMMFNNLLRLFVLFIALYPLTLQYGIIGAAIASLLATIVSFFVGMRYALRLINCSNIDYIKTMAQSAASTIIVVVAIMPFEQILPKGVGFLTFLFAIGLITITVSITILNPAIPKIFSNYINGVMGKNNS